jgi:hypothetical protein
MWSKWYSSLEEAVAPENPTTGASNWASGRLGKHLKEAGTRRQKRKREEKKETQKPKKAKPQKKTQPQ